MSTSKLDKLITPEIKDDPLYEAIKIISATEAIKTVLEIGSSSGGGSTEAFVTGLRDNPHQPTLFCMEVSKARCQKLRETYQQHEFVKCYNVSSVPLEKYATENEIRDFYFRYQTGLNIYPLETILTWLKEDREYIQSSGGLSINGIRKIKQENNIDYFDVVLIDGSQFTGTVELEEVAGAKFIILDDINTLKNYHNFQRLCQDKNYRLLEKNYQLRHGYAIFKKVTTQKIIVELVEKITAKKEEKEKLLLQKLILPRMTVFDLGANRGDYSFLLSHLVGYFGKVYAFEPTSTMVEQMEATKQEYDINNVYIYQNAVYSQNTNLEFNEFPDDYSVWNSLGKPVMKDPQGNILPAPPLQKTEIIEAITLDSFCEQHNIEKIDFLKVDVEGAESEVFKGCQNLLKNKQISYIQFEISQNMLEGMGKTAQESFDILIANGYECHRITPTGEIGEQVTGSNAYYENYIAFPSLPIHFFTIVLNGEPFIRYHIQELRQLPFRWHWHIIEGVAAHKHDTAWHLRKGGKVTEDAHNQGCSKDGTTEYLDQLVRDYPDNVTVYRKPKGEFWDGKLAMVRAPLVNIGEECLLWQVDVDEFWTTKQIIDARNLFINYPDKTAAYYWCWYFVGEDLVISSRYCYAQNPLQEWLRTWRYQPGCQWTSHAPPILTQPLPNGNNVDVAKINPFKHQETEAKDLIFQHFAYVKPEQLEFKEKYYGYKNALSEWQKLQQEQRFPTLLRQYFSWVNDGTMVDKATALGIAPILQKKEDEWEFVQKTIPKPELISPKIVFDGVFFQKYQTGIAMLWRNLLEEWVKDGFAKHLVVLDRMGTTPAIPGIRYRLIPYHNENNLEGDRSLLQQICNEEQSQLLISSYYTIPLETPSVFMAYDMIPEVLGADLNQPMWKEKHEAIQHASAYISISANTAKDLAKFFPEIDLESVTVAYCGVQDIFTVASEAEINAFKHKYGITKPYFLVMGVGGYKNPELFYQALAKLPTKEGFEVVSTGAGGLLPPELRELIPGVVVHRLQLSDSELRLAYAGAVALVYPSKYEGFGLPVLEAMSCGTPVITSPNASIPEVGGDAVIYVGDQDVDGLVEALCEVQKPKVRENLITAGLQQAQQFSWSKMAQKVKEALLGATLLPLNLRGINLLVFPDWSQSEGELYEQFTMMLQQVANYPEQKQMTLLIDTQGTNYEEANLLLSNLLMNIFMTEDIAVDEDLQVSLVPELSPLQWNYLLTRIQGELTLT